MLSLIGPVIIAGLPVSLGRGQQLRDGIDGAKFSRAGKDINDFRALKGLGGGVLQDRLATKLKNRSVLANTLKVTFLLRAGC